MAVLVVLLAVLLGGLLAYAALRFIIGRASHAMHSAPVTRRLSGGGAREVARRKRQLERGIIHVN